MKNFIKKPIVIASILVIAIIIAAYFYFSGSKKPDYEFVVVKRAGIVQEVSVTGRVKPAEDVDLAFEKSGKVSGVYIKVGNKVTAGQILVRLDNSELSSQLVQAQADLKTQKAELDELKRGTREEEINVQEVKTANAKVALEEAKKDLIDKLQDAYTKSDDTVRNKIDQFFKNPRGASPQLSFSLDDFQLKIDTEQQRLLVESILKFWKSDLDKLTLASDLNFFLKTANENLSQIKLFLDNAALAVNSAETSSSLNQTTIDSWRADVSTGRTNLNTAIVNLSTAQEKLKTAQSALALAEQELILKKSGATNEEIKAQEAQVEKAQANVLNYETQIAKTILRSPIAGLIIKQDAKEGEIVSANTPVVSVISEAKFKIEANVPEADIAKIEVGDPAEVTLDAYGEEVIFETKVINIEPAETMIEGVATYKITLQFDKEDERIKSGMTANIDVLTDSRENALVVPQRAVASKNGNKTVKILAGENIKEVEVKTGLRGSDGNIEIIEGIKEGDKVITSYGAN